MYKCLHILSMNVAYIRAACNLILYVYSEIAAANWSAEETRGAFSLGGLECAIQTSMHYRKLSQACDCHGIFIGGVII